VQDVPHLTHFGVARGRFLLFVRFCVLLCFFILVVWFFVRWLGVCVICLVCCVSFFLLWFVERDQRLVDGWIEHLGIDWRREARMAGGFSTMSRQTSMEDSGDMVRSSDFVDDRMERFCTRFFSRDGACEGWPSRANPSHGGLRLPRLLRWPAGGGGIPWWGWVGAGGCAVVGDAGLDVGDGRERSPDLLEVGSHEVGQV